MGEVELDADPAWIKSRIDVADVGLRAQAADLGRELDAARHRQATLKKQLRSFDECAAHETLEVLKTAEYERGARRGAIGGKGKGNLKYALPDWSARK